MSSFISRIFNFTSILKSGASPVLLTERACDIILEEEKVNDPRQVWPEFKVPSNVIYLFPFSTLLDAPSVAWHYLKVQKRKDI